jgi:hypothetical protein
MLRYGFRNRKRLGHVSDRRRLYNRDVHIQPVDLDRDLYFQRRLHGDRERDQQRDHEQHGQLQERYCPNLG